MLGNKEKSELTAKHLDAVKRACCHVYGSEENWKIMANTGATDKEIDERLNRIFGLGGGISGPDIQSVCWKSNPPRIWFRRIAFDEHDVAGNKLIGIVRQIFQIDEPGQISLFERSH